MPSAVTMVVDLNLIVLIKDPTYNTSD